MTTQYSQSVLTTTCPYCGVGCGVLAKVENDKLIAVEGNKAHPANEGRLCVKGSALHETTSLDNRLLTPMIHGQSSSWDEALDLVAAKFKEAIETHGPDSVAFYLSGQLLTEDYYVANKLAKGFVGTANIDTNSRLCMASAVVAHKRAFGADVVSGCYEDLESTDVLLIVGSNTAYAHPIVFQRIKAAKKKRDFKVIVIDPRRTATCEIADLHLAIQPGSDAYFFNGLLSYLSAHEYLNSDFIKQHTQNFDAALAQANEQTPDLTTVAKYCDVNESDLEQAFQWFAKHEKVVTVFSQGINQSSSGVDKGNAIINCHLATGKIGKEGATPFSITGQPNAMGGREVGGLANQLAAHMTFDEEDVAVVEEFWNAPNMARKEGLKAVDMFEAVHQGKIKAIWIMATNPVVSMPDADRVKEALDKCDFVAVSDCMANSDTGAMADVLLPASTWGEKSGTVTNSERCISYQSAVLPIPGEAKNDWQIMCEFAKRMGWEKDFNFEHQYQVFSEHAKLSGFKGKNARRSKRAFDISAMADLEQHQYLRLKPIHWPITEIAPEGTKRLFSDGKFFTPSGKANFVAINAKPPITAPSIGEFVMNTGRIRDQWHTMTRTGKAAKLLSHVSEPFVQIHPKDAENLAIQENSLVELRNRDARYLGRARITEDQRIGEIFTPMHWTQNYASFGRADALVNPAIDPLSGQPEFKQSPVELSSYKTEWQGLLICQEEFKPAFDYWAKITLDNGYGFAIADQSSPNNWIQWLPNHFPEIDNWTSFKHDNSDRERYAGYQGGVLKVMLFITRNSSTSHQWLASQLGSLVDTSNRFELFEYDEAKSTGAIICSCFQVGEKQIQQAINEGCDSSDALGKKLKCGTNCGSCIPELNSMIEAS